MENDNDKLKKDIKSLDKKISDLERLLNKIIKQQKSHNSKLITLSASHNSLSSNVDSLRSKIKNDR